MAATEVATDSGTVIAHWLTTATGGTSAITARGSRLVDVCIDFNATTANVVDLEGEYRVGITGTPATEGGNAWRVIESYTTDTVKVVRVAGQRRLRLFCSTHGETGTIAAELTSGSKE
jgi:hypothetical protein